MENEQDAADGGDGSDADSTGSWLINDEEVADTTMNGERMQSCVCVEHYQLREKYLQCLQQRFCILIVPCFGRLEPASKAWVK